MTTTALNLFGRDFWEPATSLGAYRPVEAAHDIEETEDHFLISLDAPGVPRDRFGIELANRQLRVTAERSDRRSRKWEKVFSLPEGIDTDRIEASYENGVLRINIPKAEALKPRQIAISEGKASKEQIAS